MRIGLAQIRCRPGDVAFNMRTVVDQVRTAAARGCDVVVLPEMCDTGYHMPTIVRTASTWDGGPYREAAAVAAESRITVVVGLSERIGADIYNTALVLGPDGELVAKYRKTHLITAEPVCEQNTIRPGDALVLCDIAGFRAGLMTCYDIRFPELARKLTLAGAEILIVPAAFPAARIMHWNCALRRPGDREPGLRRGRQPGRHGRRPDVRRLEPAARSVRDASRLGVGIRRDDARGRGEAGTVDRSAGRIESLRRSPAGALLTP